MTKSVYSSHINGALPAVASKSMAQRAIAVASLASSPCTINGITKSSDIDAAIQAATALGADISEKNGSCTVRPGGKSPHHIINCLEAGLTVRMFAPIAALSGEQFSFTGAEPLMKRPITMIEEALMQLGAYCSTNNGFLPMTVQGPLHGGRIKIDGAISSQLLTGLLIALPVLPDDSCIQVVNLQSRPYIDMTLDCIESFGVRVTHHTYAEFYISGGQSYKNDSYAVEGDWSGASFLLVAAALTGAVTVTNLRNNSSQADRSIVDVLQQCGAGVNMNTGSVTVQSARLTPFEYDATHCPDLFPPLVALASGIEGRSVIHGAHRLIHKESNRLETLIREFSSIGVHITEDNDALIVEGGAVAGGRGVSHDDHRIAMALACAGLIAENGVIIEDSGVVAKSYPAFFEDLASIGANIS